MNINKLTGCIVALFGVIYTALSFSLPKASVGDPLAPAIFPIVLGIGMTLLGVLYLIVKGREAAGASGKTEIPDGKKFSVKGIKHETKLIIFTCAMGVLYGLLLDPLGYVLSTIIFMGSLLFALNDGLKKWLTNVLVAVGFSAGIYVIFYYLLGIPLPMMPFFNI